MFIPKRFSKPDRDSDAAFSEGSERVQSTAIIGSQRLRKLSSGEIVVSGMISVK
jgi:hypothetical protein